jgi:tRNA pseudouridine38-40 synthase
MRWLKLVVSYDGTAYHGWQWQVDRPTIQGRIEEALERVTGERLRVTASGRTDAGVHALAQIAGCSTRSTLPPATLCRALNANLPEDIRIRQVELAAEGFDPISSTLAKRYRYYVQDARIHDVFWRRYAWFVPTPLDLSAMQQAAALLCGRHDFRGYQSAGSPRQSTIRHLRELSVRRQPTEFSTVVVIEAEADGFLYNMVRNLVGTLMAVGQGKQNSQWPRQVLEAGDRRLAGATAPPHGLFLAHVQLREDACPT